MKERNIGIDIIKFIAVIFITNSHYIPLYEDINIALATLGVHGNALFFFASGFAITLSKNRPNSFLDWYKRRIKRIWPTFIMWSIISSLVFNASISWENLVLAKGHWFIQCIMISYIALYYILHYQKKFIKIYLAISIIITTIVLFIMDKSSGSIFHSELHWICYFPSMILGIYMGSTKIIIDKIKYNKIKVIFYFILYFIIMEIGKGKDDYLYYTQIFAIIPLNLFIYYIFTYLSNIELNKLVNNKWIWNPIYLVSSLTLEIYVVQFSIITNKFNHLFPFNTIIVLIIIVFAAYILRICINVFNQTFSNEPYSVRKIFRII